LRRALGSMSMPWTWDFPYYYRDQTARLRRLGSFRSGRPWETFLFDLLSRSNALAYLGVDFPTHLSHGDIALSAQIILESKTTYERKFPGNPFYVLILPESQDYLHEFREALTERGIQFLSIDPYPISNRDRLPGDPHPSPEGQAILGERIAQLVLLVSPASM